MLETYTTDDVIDRVEEDIKSFKQPDSMTAVCYTEALWQMEQKFGMIYSKAMLKETFIEDLRPFSQFNA